MPLAQITVPKNYSITKGDKVIVLTEDEMKQLILHPDVTALILEMWKLVEQVKITEGRSTHAAKEEITPEVQSTPVTFPQGFVETHRINSDPKAARKAIFVYAQNPLSREYGYRIISPKGEVSQFNRAGAIHDPESTIGAFLRSIPKDGKPMIKQDFLKMGLDVVTEGRRLKALIDIAEIEGYLTKVVLENRKGRTGFLATAKLMELGGAHLANS